MSTDLVTSAAPWVLLALLLAATRSDVLENRIPNFLTASGALAGCALATAGGGTDGLVHALLGGAAGLAAFLPFYVLRGMAAGDVKLMAAAGTFLGPVGAFAAAMATLVAGAILAIAHVLWQRWRPLGVAERALAGGVDTRRLDIARARRERFPYAAAILVGGLCGLAWIGALPAPGLVPGAP